MNSGISRNKILSLVCIIIVACLIHVQTVSAGKKKLSNSDNSITTDNLIEKYQQQAIVALQSGNLKDNLDALGGTTACHQTALQIVLLAQKDKNTRTKEESRFLARSLILTKCKASTDVTLDIDKAVKFLGLSIAQTKRRLKSLQIEQAMQSISFMQTLAQQLSDSALIKALAQVHKDDVGRPCIALYPCFKLVLATIKKHQIPLLLLCKRSIKENNDTSNEVYAYNINKTTSNDTPALIIDGYATNETKKEALEKQTMLRTSSLDTIINDLLLPRVAHHVQFPGKKLKNCTVPYDQLDLTTLAHEIVQGQKKALVDITTTFVIDHVYPETIKNIRNFKL